VGNGSPYTVLEIVKVVEKVTGKKVPISLRPSRPGDPPILYSDPSKIKFELGWRPRYPDIESMVLHGWRWARRELTLALALTLALPLPLTH
jgi:UDP-glucose 4-epimerase